MIKGYTADEYGDFLIASLKDPYKDVEKIIDWEILIGLSDLSTVGRITLVSGNDTVFGFQTNFTNYSEGDFIIVGNRKLEVAELINANELRLTEPSPISVTNVVFYRDVNQYNYFEYEYRFSQTGQTYSEFRPLTKDTNFGDLFHLEFNPRQPLYIDVKAEAAALIPGNKLTLLSITYTLQRDNGIIESCP